MHAKLRLPPLPTLNEHSRIPYAIVGRSGEVQATGEQALQQIPSLGVRDFHVILHPDDSVLTEITLPILRRPQLHQAVLASVEPMLLDPLENLVVAHGPQNRQTGAVSVAWVDRSQLQQAWSQLIEIGLHPRSIVPHDAAPSATHNDAAEHGAVWSGTLPRWSFTDFLPSPARPSKQWRQAAYWVGAAVAVWVIGLNLYARQLEEQTQALRQDIERTVKSTFPEIPVLLNPVTQAKQQLLQRQQRNSPPPQTLTQLALAFSELPEFAQGRVQSMHYQDGQLRLVMHDPNPAWLTRAQSKTPFTQGAITFEADPAAPQTWIIRLTETKPTSGVGR